MDPETPKIELLCIIESVWHWKLLNDISAAEITPARLAFGRSVIKPH